MPASRSGRTLSAAGIALLCSACVNSMGGASLQSDMDELRLSLDRLRQEQVETRSRVDALGAPTSGDEDLQALVDDMRDRVDVLGAQVQAVVRHLDGSDEDLAGLRYDLLRLDRMVEDLRLVASTATPTDPDAPAGQDDGQDGIPLAAGAVAAGTIAAGADLPPDQPPTIGSGEDPAGIFQRAYADYARGDYALAGMGFRTTLSRDPRGPLADDAVYYLAEVAAAEGDTQGAMAGYARVVEEFPTADKAPAALLKHGLLLIDANRIGEGVVQLDHLVKTYPQSEEARLARNKLRALGVGF